MLKIIKRFFTTKTQNANKMAKKEQIKHAAVLLLVGGLSYGFYCYSSSDLKKTTTNSEETPFDGVFESTFNQGSDEALLVQQQQQLETLKKMIKANEKKQEKQALPAKEDAETKTMLTAMQEQLSHLQEENKKMHEQLQVALLSSQQASLTSVRPPTREEMELQKKHKYQFERELLLKSGLETVAFKTRKNRQEEHTSKNYVWAGTFAEGVLLTGILGDAGINGSKNMGAALIRLTSGGIMPNNQYSHLEDCSVLVSSYGDLSGSSVVLHLETLSCAGKKVNFEQKVYGSVFDLDAMQDLRGTSILKTKPLLGYSAAAGMLAGFGDGLKNLNTAQTINPGAGTITTYGEATTLAQSAAGGGLSNPANRIADYVMRIADIYHPLVVARAGRRVSVLFTKGFWIDKKHQVYESGKSINEGLTENESSIKATVNAASETTADQDSLLAGNTPESLKLSSTELENKFLSQQGQVKMPLFSSVQNEGVSHE